jgi:hypothetical protein
VPYLTRQLSRLLYRIHTGDFRAGEVLAVEHRGIEYDIKITIVKNQWVWALKTSSPKQGKVSGTRNMAIAAAVKAIEQWCSQHRDDCEPPIR